MARQVLTCAVLIVLGLALAGCAAAMAPVAPPTTDVSGGDAMQLTSSAFANGNSIPTRYTCDGENVSPPLAWTGVPPAAKALVLIVDDPDAPGGAWVHWVVINLPADATPLPEAVPAGKPLDHGAVQGTTSFRQKGYGGPCPPGGTHRYYFRLYALDAPLALTGTTTAKDVQGAMKGHVLAQAELMGRYARR
jgi:Raf kinase inhibitor-like YbhB/YbcL family protein